MSSHFGLASEDKLLLQQLIAMEKQLKPMMVSSNEEAKADEIQMFDRIEIHQEILLNYLCVKLAQKIVTR